MLDESPSSVVVNEDGNLTSKHESSLMHCPISSPPAVSVPSPMSFKKYTDYFDIPPLFSSGSVHVYDNKLVATFPEQSGENNLLDHKYLPYVNIFVDKKQLFSYDWLPIYTVSDLEKCQDIFCKMFCEYSALMAHHYVPPPYLSGIYNLIETSYDNSEFLFSARENYNSATIEIELKKNKQNYIIDCLLPVHIQIYIGPFLVLCSERDLPNMSFKSLNYVIHYLLMKLSKNYYLLY
jgi:hypothetical protein